MASRFSKWRAAKASTAIRLRFKSQLVEKIPLFAGLSAKESQQIARLVNEIAVPAGTRLATAGEAGGELFAIIEGEAVVRTKPGRTATLTAGDCDSFGRASTSNRGSQTFNGSNGFIDATTFFFEGCHYVRYVHDILSQP